MAEVSGTLTDHLLARARDSQGIANTRAFARSILNDVQRVVNAASNRVLTTGALTTNPLQMFYPITATFTDSIRVRAVREGDRDLEKVTLKQLNQFDDAWFRRVGPKFEVFVPVGRDLLVVWPAKEVASSVDVVYAKLTTDLPDEDLHDVLDLSEIILLAKSRRFDLLAPLMERLTARGLARTTPQEV